MRVLSWTASPSGSAVHFFCGRRSRRAGVFYSFKAARPDRIQALCIIAFIGEDLTLTPAQEFRETRDWLAQHKRDPFLWLAILMPLTLGAYNFGATIVLLSVFP